MVLQAQFLHFQHFHNEDHRRREIQDLHLKLNAVLNYSSNADRMLIVEVNGDVTPQDKHWIQRVTASSIALVF